MKASKLDKLKRKLTDSTVEELDKLDEAALQKTVADSSEAIEKAVKERNNNPRYKSAKTTVDDFAGGLRDLKTYQNAKILYSIHRLRGLRGENEQE